MIISQTPLRISFLGGGSDLPAYYRQNGGAVLSTAIDRSIYVTVSKKFDDAVRVSYSRTEEVPHADQIEHPLVREALRSVGIEGGIEITSVADIPAKGTGLGSSSSFTVGLLNALHAHNGRHSSAATLAAESCEIEINRCGEPIGKQDQYAAAFGGFNFIRFNRDDTVEVQKILCPRQVIHDIESRLLFFYTGITRSASDLLRTQSESLASPGEATDAMAQMVHMAESARTDICAGNIDSLGALLDTAWTLKKSLSPGISNPLVDSAYEAARAAGAQGGKLLGAGGGGFLMFFSDPNRHEAIRQALPSLRETPFRFSPQGSRIIFVH